MDTKVIDKKNRTPRKWHDTAIYWKRKGTMFMYERSINTILWCQASCFPNDIRELYEINLCGCYKYAIGQKAKGAKFATESEMTQGAEMITRKEFAKQWNLQKLALPTTIEP